MSRPWMPLYVADYLRDTRRLTPAEHGAYLLLIMEYWTACELPDDDLKLARIVGMTAAEWRKAKPTVQAFFTDGWRHQRIDDEIAKAEAKHERRSEAGKRGGIASANAKQNSSNAQASSSQPQSQEESSLRSDSARAKRGTRLPADWKPSAVDLNEAMSKLGGPIPAQQELEKFHDYWKAQPGQRGVKLDWDATWRNWIRNAKGQGNGHRTANPRTTGHDAILAAASRAAGKITGDGAMAGPGNEAEFPEWGGSDGQRSHGAADADGGVDQDHHRREPGAAGVREGEIIPPDKAAAGISGGRFRH
jgi:uncharacterized protein YdaU (DUF1376 family)